jgi:hypothetical protein
MPPVVVYTGETDPGMIAKADAGMGVSVDMTPVQPKKTKLVPLPRIRPAHVSGPTAALKPAKLIVIKAAQTIQ